MIVPQPVVINRRPGQNIPTRRQSCTARLKSGSGQRSGVAAELEFSGAAASALPQTDMQEGQSCTMPKRASHKAPGWKRMDSAARLERAKAWLAAYTGKDLVRAYHKYFGVDRATAVHELKLLGVPVSANYLTDFNNRVRELKQARVLRRKQMREPGVNSLEDLQDERFAFIVGHTPGGAPYGLTWEQTDEELRRQLRTNQAEDKGA